MNDLDELIDYLVATDQVDECFGLKETCPICYKPLDKTNDPEYPYYCKKCNKYFNKNLTETKEEKRKGR